MRRTVAAALAAALAAAVAAGCGGGSGQGPGSGGEPGAAPQRATLADRVVRLGPMGAGSDRWFTYQPAGSAGRALGLVVFLHGWGQVDPRPYERWIAHIAARGNMVVYPAYQRSFASDPRLVLGATVRALRRALARASRGAPSARARAGTAVALGYSAGGALAFDLAAVGRARGLPPMRGVMSVFPGRRLPGIPLGIPPADPAGIPPGMSLLVMAGDRDLVVGGTGAAKLFRSAPLGAGRKAYGLVRSRGRFVASHPAPQRPAGPVERATFWRSFDLFSACARTAQGCAALFRSGSLTARGIPLELSVRAPIRR